LCGKGHEYIPLVEEVKVRVLKASASDNVLNNYLMQFPSHIFLSMGFILGEN